MDARLCARQGGQRRRFETRSRLHALPLRWSFVQRSPRLTKVKVFSLQVSNQVVNGGLRVAAAHGRASVLAALGDTRSVVRVMGRAVNGERAVRVGHSGFFATGTRHGVSLHREEWPAGAVPCAGRGSRRKTYSSRPRVYATARPGSRALLRPAARPALPPVLPRSRPATPAPRSPPGSGTPGCRSPSSS